MLVTEAIAVSVLVIIVVLLIILLKLERATNAETRALNELAVAVLGEHSPATCASCMEPKFSLAFSKDPSHAYRLADHPTTEKGIVGGFHYAIANLPSGSYVVMVVKDGP